MNERQNVLRFEKTNPGIRITIIIPGLSAGGTEHVVNLIANHWRASGHTVTIITFETPESISYYPLHPDVTVVRLGVPPRRTSKLGSAAAVGLRILRLRSAIQLSKPDFILSFLTRTNVMVLAATFSMPVPVVVSERNNPAVQPFGRIWKWLQSHLYPRAFGLVTMTQGALDYFPAAMRRRGWVIANAVDLPGDWVDRRKNNTLTAVGRLTHQKGFDLLLKAFAQIAAKHPDWRLVIWGEGDDRKALEAQRDALGLRERVEMPGVTSRPGLWVETADVFVLSSRYEGWGIVLLEAMAAGLPVVSYECEWGPGTMVTNGDDGILVPCENVDALAGALDAMLGNAALRKTLAAKAAVSARNYLPESILARWDEVLLSAVRQDAGSV
ncbi:glycosyltransferase family 4 protein [Pararhizobium sp. YC-54]|uniref:glycosyltransferase family 4 protein n=1 Tax=Pararhizobium sp. YC-54 TaxID=2986920 RepID=UPI0021F72D55|nr:glycosyltransferase family 4 protein [Pararhizobium sp. YC-54]MCV9999540.1 glycosyltransferase family 4 protein [Pararhizobium sp. YC-54]